MLIPFLGRIPIDPEIVVSGDSGKPLVVISGHEEAKNAFTEISKNWRKLLEEKSKVGDKKSALVT